MQHLQEQDDLELLRQYADHNSDDAFAVLVARHINQVYSAALRHVGNPVRAGEITQTVFVILARKARSLRKNTLLSAWLYQTTRFASLTFLKSEIRRARREHEAYMQGTLNDPDDSAETWKQVRPVLDIALAALGEPDRNAIVLRFFDNRSLKQVAAALGTSEDAAKHRVHRAVEKLRHFFSKRGFTFSAAVLSSALATHSVEAAPAVLAKTVTTAALAKGATAAGSTLTLIKSTLKLMAWSKVKTTIAAGAVLLLVAGTATVSWTGFSTPSIEYTFQHPSQQRPLEKAAPMVVLRPARYPNLGSRVQHMHGPPFSRASERFVGVNQLLQWALAAAYDVGPEQMLLPREIRKSNFTFDFLVTVPANPRGAFADEIRRQFGLIGRRETQQHDVLVLKVAGASVPLMKVNRSGSTDHGVSVNRGTLALVNFHMAGQVATVRDKASGSTILNTNLDDSFVRVLGGCYLGLPVIDETGLTDAYDIQLQWDAKLTGTAQAKAIEQAVRNQLGLELVPEQRSVEMLVVEYEDGHEHGPPIPQASWTHAGYDTPEAAFESALWAMTSGDVQTFLNSLTPDAKKDFLARDGKGKQQAQIAGQNRTKAARIGDFQILARENLSDDEATLFIHSTKAGNAQVTMKKLDGQWRMADEPH